MAYATKTGVSVDATRSEIERICVKHGATRFTIGWEGEAAGIMFEMRKRRVRFSLKLPGPEEKRVRKDAKGKARTQQAQARELEQLRRSAWRGLLLVIRAKLEAVEQGIEVFEDAFLAQMLVPLPGGGTATVGEWAAPLVARAYDEGAAMPSMLPGASDLRLAAGDP